MKAVVAVQPGRRRAARRALGLLAWGWAASVAEVRAQAAALARGAASGAGSAASPATAAAAAAAPAPAPAPTGPAPGASTPSAPSSPAPSTPPRGTTFALLIAVNRPTALPQRLWLRGPDNDAALMRQALLERGVAPDHITWLGGAPGATGLATRAAIEAAMQGLLQRLHSGDHLVLHLAGHGVQVPQRPGAEPEADGLDEVFLTADTQPWDAAQGVLPQALYDHDIGRFIDAVAQRGAQVLAVFDTCHAAGLQRGAPGAPTRQRGVARAELGVPQGAAALAASRARPAPAGHWAASLQPRPTGRPGPGPVLALAARSHESTPEAWLPAGAAQARVHGVFSYAVVQALRGGAGDAAALRSALAGLYAQAGRVSPVPLVVGEGQLLPRKP